MISMKPLIIEGRYDSIVTELSRKLLTVVKNSYSAVTNPNGEFSGQKIFFKQNEPVPNIDDDDMFQHVYFEEVENQTIPLEFYLQLKIQWVENLKDLKVGGDAWNDSGRDSDSMPLIEVRFELDPSQYPSLLSAVAMELRDVLRHELEHTTQSGWNTKGSKYLPSDAALRKKIWSGQLPSRNYFLLKKEIPAMIHGLYNKAKKSRQPFSKVVNRYLDGWVTDGMITSADTELILKTWKSYLPKLGIRQEL